jgi:transposase InsO family protein
VKITNLTELLGYSKQAYYKKIKTKETKDIQESLILDLIKNKRKLWKKGSGRNLYSALKKDFTRHKIKIGRDRFFDLLRENNLLIKKKQRRTRTTFSYHHFHKYPNLIRELELTRVNQVIVTDITYLYLRDTDSFAYLFLVTDLFSRKILGFNVSDNLSAKSGIKALRMALRNMSDTNDTIHHSDRGIQYCSNKYTEILKRNNIRISMTENSDPLENAVAERINKTLKEEFTNDRQISFSNFNEAGTTMRQIINFYNDERPHRSLEMNTPNTAYLMNKVLKRKWKTYYRSVNKDIEIIDNIIKEKNINNTCSESY